MPWQPHDYSNALDNDPAGDGAEGGDAASNLGDFLGEERIYEDDLAMSPAYPSSSEASEPVARLQAASAAVEVSVVVRMRNGLSIGEVCASHFTKILICV